MADFVTIANLAASAIGEDDQLRSPDDDTHLSRTVRAVWDLERRAALRDHSWNFAMARKQLPAQSLPEIPYPWGYSFKLPADAVRLIEVLGRPVVASRSDYQLEGGCILSNTSGPMAIRYLRDIAEPALWDDLFVKAFAMRIAWQIADRITGDLNRVEGAERKYRRALADAKRADALENPSIPFEPTGWERARMSGAGYDNDILIGCR